MDSLNELFLITLGWTWVLDYATLFFIVAAALALILLIVLIVVGVRHSKIKKQRAKMQAEIDSLKANGGAGEVDVERIREQVRAELEPQIRSQVESEYEERLAAATAARDEFAPQAETDNTAFLDRIDELNAQLAQKEDELAQKDAAIAALNASAGANDDIGAELRTQIAERDSRIQQLQNELSLADITRGNDSSELNKKIDELSYNNRKLQENVNSARSENTLLQNQIASLKKQLADAQQQAAKPAQEPPRRAAEQKPAPAPSRPEPRSVQRPVQKQAPVKEAPVVDDDDDEEEIDDFGNGAATVKVTLKYDREKANWVINRSDTARAYRRIVTKQEAMVVAKDLARRLHATLVVHKKDGKFQKLN